MLPATLLSSECPSINNARMLLVEKSGDSVASNIPIVSIVEFLSGLLNRILQNITD